MGQMFPLHALCIQSVIKQSSITPLVAICCNSFAGVTIGSKSIVTQRGTLTRRLAESAAAGGVAAVGQRISRQAEQQQAPQATHAPIVADGPHILQGALVSPSDCSDSNDGSSIQANFIAMHGGGDSSRHSSKFSGSQGATTAAAPPPDSQFRSEPLPQSQHHHCHIHHSHYHICYLTAYSVSLPRG